MSKVCLPRFLPRSEWARAAQNAMDVNPENRPPDLAEGQLPVGQEGEKLAVDVRRFWGRGGVKLTVGFIDTPDLELRRRIVGHMNAWNQNANVTFIESEIDPHVRIARFDASEARPGEDGYWSYLGTDILLAEKDQPTMNLEAFTMDTDDAEFFRVVRHEAGHTLGFPHEHMRAAIIERLDRAKVIASFRRSQGWTEQEVIDQILTPLEESWFILPTNIGTPGADETSIMCYQIEGNLTVDGQPVVGGLDINATDHAFAGTVYPKTPA
jgi:hypothetical protein